MSGLGNIIFNLTFLSMIFQCLRRACLIYFPAKLRLYLVLKTRGIAVDFSLSLMKCWRSSKLIEASALESSASLHPLAESFSMKKPFFLTNVSRLLLLMLLLLLLLFVCLFVIADDLTSKETVEDGLWMALRPACAKIVQSLSSLYDIWCPGFLFHQIVSLCKYSLYGELNTQGPTPSNRRQDHDDHSSCPFRAATHRETYKTSIDWWSIS